MKNSVSAVSRVIAAVVIIVIIIIAGVGIYAGTRSGSSSSSSSSTQTSSSTSSSSTSTSSTSPSQSSSSATSTISSSSSSSSSSSTLISTSNSSTTSGSNSQLVIDEASPAGTNDPGTAFDNNALEIGQNTNLPLVFCADAACSTLTSVLATSWSESSNGMNYTFILRSNAHYSNGDPFNAYVVWYNVYRDMIMNQGSISFIFSLTFNTTNGVTAGDLNGFNNAQNVPANSTLLKLTQNPNNIVTVDNSTAVTFHLTNPFVAFTKVIDTDPWVFVDPYVVSSHSGVTAGKPNTWMAVNGTMVGDGPYITQTFLPNQYTILVANPNYWAQNITGNLILQAAHIRTITINYKTDELTRSLDLSSNKAQASIISFNDIPNVLKTTSNVAVPNTGISNSIEAFVLDTEKAPLNNTLVRQAVNYAINVSEIDNSVYNGYAVPFVGPNAKGFFGYNNSISPTPFNVSYAKALLVKAGYPNGQGLPPISLIYPSGPYLTLVVQIMQQELSAVGINLQPQQVSSSTWNAFFGVPGTNASTPDIFYSGFTGYSDFSEYTWLTSPTFGLLFYYNNATVNKLIAQSNVELNATARAHEISLITQYTQQQAAAIWLAQATDFFDTGVGFGPIVWNNCVTGLWYNGGFNGVDFNSLSYSCSPT